MSTISALDEAPTFSSTAYNSNLPEYSNSGTVTRYAGFIGNIFVRDNDTYATGTNGLITMSISGVTDYAGATVTPHPFYFNVTSANNYISTALSYDTDLCTGLESLCLSYFDYVSTPAVPTYTITMLASDNGSPVRSASITYVIRIAQVFSAPVFASLPVSFCDLTSFQEP